MGQKLKSSKTMMERSLSFCFALVLIYTASATKVHLHGYNCPLGDFEHNGQCYKRVTEKIQGRYYNERCKAMHYDALTILSAEENAFIMDNVIPDGNDDWWIGMSDREKEGEWMWFKDGSPLGQYHNWAPGQPDDYRVVNQDIGQDCAVIWVHLFWDNARLNGTWDDQECNYSYWPYICQREAGAFVENVCEGATANVVADPVDERCFYL